MDPTPVTVGQFFSLLGAVIIGVAVGGGLPLAALWLGSRLWDRWALRQARAAWHAWLSTHPEEAEDDLARRRRISRELWLAEQPAHVQAHLLRERLADARREAQVEAILDAERRGERDGR